MSQWTYFKQRRNFLVVLREILKSDHSIIGEVYKCETSHLTDPVLSLRLNHVSGIQFNIAKQRFLAFCSFVMLTKLRWLLTRTD